MSYFFHAVETTRSKAEDTSLCPVTPCQYLICTDSGDVFYDTKDGVRKHLTDIIDLSTDTERVTILTPLDKVYFVKETAHFWRYLDGEWTDLSMVASATLLEMYVKVFDASEWDKETLVIPASDHGQSLNHNEVLAKVYMLSGGSYSEQCLAAMDTSVHVNEDKSVVLSYSGTPYSGKVILIG